MNDFRACMIRPEIERYNLIRVDSTIVSEASSKMKEVIDQKKGKKFVKFNFSIDKISPSGVAVFNPAYVLDFVMKIKRAKKMKRHGNFPADVVLLQ